MDSTKESTPPPVIGLEYMLLSVDAASFSLAKAGCRVCLR